LPNLRWPDAFVASSSRSRRRPARPDIRVRCRRQHLPELPARPDLPVIGALAEHYTTLDRYFCAFAGETFPNRFYQHAGQTDRDRNSEVASTLPTIWDQLSPIPNSDGIPTGGYYYRDSPFLALWASPAIEPGATFKYQAFFHPFSDADAATAALSAGTSFNAACQNGTLPNVCYIDPAVDDEGTGTSGDDHPLGDIRLGERFIADAYHALADNGYLDDTVFIVTFDEWGGFYDHVPPPQVIDDTNPADVMHAGDGTTPTDGQLVPNYRQLGFRVPGLVVTNLAVPRRVVHDGPFEHCSSLALIESTFGLTPLTARDRSARNIGDVLLPRPVPAPIAVPPSAIPTSSDVIGPAISPPSESLLQVLTGTGQFDPADICSAASSGLGSVLGRPARRRSMDSRHDPCSQRAAAASAAQSTDTLMRQYGSASAAAGWNVRRYRASAGLALAALKW
jgi:Phosphoesterase family